MLPSRLARQALRCFHRPHQIPRTLLAKPSRFSSTKATPPRNDSPELPDHRKVGAQQELFMTSIYSPGSPIFLPNGARIFNRLVDFLRRQYVSYGFEEVITPNIYKKSLWEVSGHLQNYADDMYTVTSTSRARQPEATSCPPEATSCPPEATSCCGDREPPTATSDGSSRLAEGEDDDYGLKPMNCPGHCLIFASKARSYRDLPIRYADFSPLHRNEISGALSGLTRVRRFHQDDGHVFCRPVQIQPEVFRTLAFMKSVYGALGLGDGYAFALSTRPADHYIGTDAEWARAEAQLRGALEQAGLAYTVKAGDGAFYGPKIDVMLRDSHGKTHQAGTIQLDFQLPQRFGLEYSAPAPALEARGVFRTLDFMKSVYGALGLGDGYAFALSTRPADHYIGTDAEWARAEAQLRGALEQAGLAYTVKAGDGAFYGPKIDVMLRDSHGKTHQAGTIQLDFQLPQRFGLEYSAPAPALEARGVPLAGVDAALRETYGPVTPVLIHRAILGSVERLMALLIEEYNGKWPFWLNPRQAAILTLNDTDPVVDWAAQVRRTLLGIEKEGGADAGLSQPNPTGFTVDVDASTRPLGEKLAEARAKEWPFWLNPRQAAILTLNDTDPVVDWAAQVQRTLLGVEDEGGADAGLSQPHPTGFTVDVDVSTRPLGEKLAEARAKAYGMILVVGKQNVEQGTVTLNSRDAATRSREDLTPTDLLRRMKELVDKYQ
ncbi:hypothetical protein BN1708_016706 [Verticillium longisporum]|uniref:threonine--tRNA ligase n=1 Tax=Verticillium longisporum TaxID=100787 RepID=A0A0G4MXY9_VERLO|nr:hypothetical protein BN1708_016706 [Verticillium longisporum]